MASIVIRQFGGMMPSANRKAIPEAAATYVRNLNPRFGDFRPIPLAADVATVTAGETLYKFDGEEVFISKPGNVSFVRGPIPNDTAERTYYTGDGLPKVTDLTGEVRQLGVPAPSAAPLVTVNAVSQFSRDDSDAFLPKVKEVFQNTLWANRQWTYQGLNDAELADFFNPSTLPWQFDFTIPGSLVSSVFHPTIESHRNLMDARLGYIQDTTDAANPFGYVPTTMRAGVLSFTANLEPALKGILNPEDGTSQLLTDEQVDGIIETLENRLGPADTARDAAIERMRKLKSEFVDLANSTSVLTQADSVAVQAFYLRADITAATTAARNAAAIAILNAVATYNTSGGIGGS